MQRVRVRQSEYVFKWLCFLGVVSLGIAWTLWQLKVNKGREEAPQETQVAQAPPVVAPEVKPAKTKKKEVGPKETAVVQSETTEPAAGPSVSYPAADPVVTPAPVRAAAPAPSEPRLGVEEEAPEPAKAWVEAEDKTYVGKVVPCEGQKYDRSTVMGGAGFLDYFYMCLDVGTAFTKVKVDNLFNPVMFSYKGNDFYRAVNLRKNDVVRVKVNDGQALKVEMVKSVTD